MTKRSSSRARGRTGGYTSISPIIIFVSDFEKSLQFYRRAFGLRLLRKYGEWAELDAGGLVLALHGGYKGRKARHGAPFALHFLTRNIEKTTRLVKKWGGQMIREPRKLDFRPDELVTAIEARFRDPDGNESDLRQVVDAG